MSQVTGRAKVARREKQLCYSKNPHEIKMDEMKTKELLLDRSAKAMLTEIVDNFEDTLVSALEVWMADKDRPASADDVIEAWAATDYRYRSPDAESEDRIEPNGASVEKDINAAIDQLEFYQTGKSKSHFNERAIEHLRYAVDVLQTRTVDREVRKVEGTHEI